MKRFRHYITESKCNCPEGWSVFASFKTWCICKEDNPSEGEQVTHRKGTLGEFVSGEIVNAQDIPKMRFPLLDDPLVEIELREYSISIRIGESDFFEVPKSEEEHVWEVIKTLIDNSR